MEEKIKEWLQKGGFPLEMKCTNSLLKNAFVVAQSVYYQDAETAKFRETDIIASKFREINGTWTHITFVIECKKTPNKPWVILKNDKLINHINEDLPVYYTRNCKRFIHEISKEDVYKSELFFKNERSLGYSIQTAFANKGVDRSYEAIQSVTKASEYFSEKINSRSNICAFYFPIIIIEGKLFEGKLNDDEIEIEEVNNSEVLITRSFHDFGNSHIRIFESSDLDFVSGRLNDLAEKFFQEYKKHLEDSIPKTREKPYG